MTTYIYRYRMNGLIDTNAPVLENMERIANSCASWISFDNFTGLWDVVINKPESVSRAFDDSNIIGAINLNVLSLKEMYNAVEVQFPHSDLNDTFDYIKIAIPAEDRLTNEPENVLTLRYDLLSDPVQAQLLGLIELKQARLDKTIQFRTDYTATELAAGDVITVTNSLYGWTAKEFRIVTIKEVTDSEALYAEITALEYDADIFDTSDLNRYIRSNANGILDIGAIGIPNPVQVSKFETSSRPRILAEADVPGGLVNGMEFWLTTDVLIGSDDNRNYRLAGKVNSPAGTNYTTGDTVELDIDNLNSSNFYVKVRGTNDTTTGPFSEPSGLVEYDPTQVTDAIGNAAILDSNVSPIGGLVGANALLWLLNQLLGGSGGNSATITDQLGSLFDLFGNTASNFGNGAASLSSVASNGSKVQISASAGQVTASNLPQSSSFSSIGSTTFSPSVSGFYVIQTLFDQNSSGANGGRGAAWSEVEDIIIVNQSLKQGGTTLVQSSSGGVGAFFWTDFIVTNTTYLTAGTTYTLEFFYIQDTGTNPSGVASFDISWNVFSRSLDL